jgi:protein involved in polysaccharide export with SLBB domain
MLNSTGNFARKFFWITSLATLSCGTALGQSQFLVEQTRLRLNVVQLMPQTGQYSRWEALSGEMMVGPGGILTVPIIGSIEVGDMSLDELSRDIAARFQKKMGLIDPPDASIEVVAYPPIYIVGAVTQPGEYAFRPGMTVLQALALGGGQRRSEDATSTVTERIRLLAEFRTLEDQIARAGLRVARLNAELAEATKIDAPADADGNNLAQEQAVLEAGRTARDRQIASLTDLKALYQQEIEVLETRTTDIEKAIASTEKELAGVEQLVSSGMATVARRSELERQLASLRSDRLEQATAIMRAKQFMTEAERNADGIEDTRRSELSQQLLTEQASLEKLERDAETNRTLLANLDRRLLAEGTGESGSSPALIFSVIRTVDGKAEEVPVTDTELLLPSDVVKVAIATSAGAETP